jgi:PEP-CTERM motif
VKHRSPLTRQSQRLIKHSVGAMVGLVLAGLTNAHAAVESGHWRAFAIPTTTSNGGANLNIQIDQTPLGDYTGTLLSYDSKAGTLKFVTYNVDEGSKLFVTRPGQFINDNTLVNLAYADRLSFSDNVAKVGTDFYVGGATEKFSDPGFDAYDQHWTVFGWAHLKLDANGQLQVVDSAVSFNEGGIVAGSLAVPEASTWSLMALGLVGLSWATRQQRRPRTS